MTRTSTRAKRKAAGLCTTCARPLPPDPGHPARATCDPCRRAYRAYAAAKGWRYTPPPRPEAVSEPVRAEAIPRYAARVEAIYARYGGLEHVPDDCNETIFNDVEGKE